MKRVVTFGEIMLRLTPSEFERFSQANTFEATYGGCEANVAVSLARFGEQTGFVTRLPSNGLGDACLSMLRSHNVDTRDVTRGGERIGIYFLEKGVAQRGGDVIYDRSGSSFATVEPGMIDWEAVFDDADWFHWSGIAPAVSPGAAATCREAVTIAHRKGLMVSCDLNYRAKLWQWGKHPNEVMGELVAMCDVLLASEEAAAKMLGLAAHARDAAPHELMPEAEHYFCDYLSRHFPSLTTIAVTMRGSFSASHNIWSGALWSRGEFYTACTHEIIPIVDRVGAGDAFMGGLIHGLRKYQGEPERSLNFAVAAGCLKHSIKGDFNLVSIAEVEKLMNGADIGRVSR